MSWRARRPDARRRAERRGRRDRLPRQRRAHEPRPESRCGATATSRRPPAGTPRDMARRNYFSHVTPGGEDLGDRLRDAGYGDPGDGWRAGENLGWGTGTAPPPRAVDEWLASPRHKRNMLEKSFRELGVGCRGRAPSDHRRCPAPRTRSTSASSAPDRARMRQDGGMTASAPSGATCREWPDMRSTRSIAAREARLANAATPDPWSAARCIAVSRAASSASAHARPADPQRPGGDRQALARGRRGPPETATGARHHDGEYRPGAASARAGPVLETTAARARGRPTC